MNHLLSLFTLVITLGCSHSIKSKEISKKTPEPVWMKISPGEVRLVTFPIESDEAKFICKNNEVKYVKKDNMAVALVTENYFSDLNPFNCKVQLGNKVLHEMKFSVIDREYPSEQLRVDSKKIQLSKEAEARVQREQVILNKIYDSSSKELLFDGPFMAPLKSYVTSIYGIKRLYNKKKKGQHLGTDFRAAIGVKVPAANDGKVVFAGDLFYTGYTVIIDHGLDIFTVYGHLSENLVKTGDIIKKGHIIALSGNTGRSSGPHLHWGVKVQGQYIDGFNLITETEQYFNKK